jgi:drug/metabolite transporter (DMT)-like permease
MTLLYVLPFIGAILYGLNYAIMGAVLKSMSISTFLLFNFFVSAVFTAAVIWFDRANLNVAQLQAEPRITLMLALAITVAWGAWMITTVVMKHINPTYAAIGEIAYPVFVPIFAWVLFRDKQWDAPTLVGGALVFLGLFIMIYTKTRAEGKA